MASFSVAFAPLKSPPFTTTTTTTTSSTSTTAAINQSLCYLKTHRNIMNGTVFCCQNSNHARAKSHVVSSVPTTADVVVDSGIAVTTTATTTAAAVDAATITTVQTGMTELDRGIGIVDFIQGKNYFITGATGFLGKVLIEKLLRSAEVGKIFVLIKAKDMDAAMYRLKTEIIESELFSCIEQIHGKSYKSFMLSKLIPIVGDVSKSNLGMDDNSAHELATQVDVIINSAANTTFYERFDVALNTNTSGPARLLRFAKRCKNLVIFVHVSTAYVNGEREGVVLEKPFYMGESIAGEKTGVKTPARFPVLDIEAEMKLASDTKNCVPENQVAEKMKEMGVERANMYGWQNTYVFTKAMGEMMINSMRGDIPVVIIRPSIIESTYKEPFPGWIQGNRMLDPLIISYGKGQLPGFVANPKTVLDVVPADMVVNSILAAMAKHGKIVKPELKVYQVASSVVNPMLFQDVFKFSRSHFNATPLMDSKGEKVSLQEMKVLSSLDDFSSYIYEEIVRQSKLSNATKSDPKLRNKIEMKCKKKAAHVMNMARSYEPFMFYKGWFDNENMKKLMKEMSLNEAREFGFEVGSINWEKYMVDVHIPGLRKYVMKGRLVSL